MAVGLIIKSLIVMYLSQLTSKQSTYTAVFVVCAMSNRVLLLRYESVRKKWLGFD